MENLVVHFTQHGSKSIHSPQQPLARHMIELEPDTVRVFEQQRVIARRPLILARRANDLDVERTQKAMQLVDIGALAGAETQMMQADALLLERGTRVLRRRRADANRGASADAVMSRLGIDHRRQPEKRQ